MSQTVHTDVAVETSTNYADDLDAENPITIDIKSLDPDMYVELCQRLSFILEEPSYADATRFTKPLVGMHDTFPVEVSRGGVTEAGSYTIVIEVEGLSDDGARQAVEHLTTAVATGDPPEARNVLGILVAEAAEASRRSIVHLVRNGNSTRPDLEWHTGP